MTSPFQPPCTHKNWPFFLLSLEVGSKCLQVASLVCIATRRTIVNAIDTTHTIPRYHRCLNWLATRWLKITNQCNMKYRKLLRGWLLYNRKTPPLLKQHRAPRKHKWISAECWETLNAESIDSRSEQIPSNPDCATTSEAAQLLEQNSSNLDNGTPIWANQDVEELLDYSEQVFWEPDPDSDADNEVAKLSSTTIKIVEDAFLHSLPNERQRSIKRKQPVPDKFFAKCPKLDTTILSRLPKTAKNVDRNMARLQTLTLDAGSP